MWQSSDVNVLRTAYNYAKVSNGCETKSICTVYNRPHSIYRNVVIISAQLVTGAMLNHRMSTEMFSTEAKWEKEREFRWYVSNTYNFYICLYGFCSHYWRFGCHIRPLFSIVIVRLLNVFLATMLVFTVNNAILYNQMFYQHLFQTGARCVCVCACLYVLYFSISLSLFDLVYLVCCMFLSLFANMSTHFKPKESDDLLIVYHFLSICLCFVWQTIQNSQSSK